MRKTMIYLTESQRAAVSRYARSQGKSMAEVIRDAVDRLVAADRRRPRGSRFVASGAGPERAAVSEQAEELLRAHLRRRRPS